MLNYNRDRTGYEFYVAQKLLASAKVEGNRVIRRRCGQKNAWEFVAEHGPGMRLIIIFFGPYAPDVQTSQLSVFSILLQEVKEIRKTRNQFTEHCCRYSFSLDRLRPSQPHKFLYFHSEIIRTKVKQGHVEHLPSARHWRFAGEASTPPLTKGILTPPWGRA